MIYDHAAWMRYLAANHYHGPDILASLPEGSYERFCRYYLQKGFARRTANKAVSRLLDAMKQYDEVSLLAEITCRSGVRANISMKSIARQNNVPTLEASLPLTDVDMDECLRIFLLFALWPKQKPYAWARFTNVNPVEIPEDLQTITCFYIEQSQTFTLVVKRLASDLGPDFDLQGLTIEELAEFGSVAVLAEI